MERDRALRLLARDGGDAGCAIQLSVGAGKTRPSAVRWAFVPIVLTPNTSGRKAQWLEKRAAEPRKAEPRPASGSNVPGASKRFS